MTGDSTVAKRYAKAFLHEKVNEAALERMIEELRALVVLFDEDDEAREFFESPVNPRGAKTDAVGKIADEHDMSAFTRSLLELLIRKDRMSILASVYEQLLAISDEKHGRIRVTVTTAMEPSEQEIGEISKRVSDYFGKNTIVHRQIDAAIIGGFVVEGGGRRIDLSVAGQIRRALTK